MSCVCVQEGDVCVQAGDVCVQCVHDWLVYARLRVRCVRQPMCIRELPTLNVLAYYFILRCMTSYNSETLVAMLVSYRFDSSALDLLVNL